MIKDLDCRQYGHKSTECQAPPKTENTADKTKQNADQRREAGVHVSSFKNHDCDDPLCKIIRMNGRELHGLIDTGSDVNLIKASAFIQIGTPTLETKILELNGIGKEKVKTLGTFKMTIGIDDVQMLADIHAMPDDHLPTNVIIGRNFLDKVTLIANSKEVKIMKTPQDAKTEFKTIEDTKKKIVMNEKENCKEESSIFLSKIAEDNDLELDIGQTKYNTIIKNIVRDYTPIKVEETTVKLKLILTDEEPVFETPRRLPKIECDEVQRQINNWLNDGIVRLSSSDFASPIVLVKKKNGETRICVDYRKLNRKIIKDRYPLPIIEDQLDKLCKAKVFTMIDLKNGFFHVPVEENSVKYTSFVTPFGQFEFLKTPFGICNSPAVFQRFVNNVFKELIQQGIFLTYMDDLAIPAANGEEAIERLKQVLAQAEKHGLLINWKKCQFLKTKMEYLGHEVENGMVNPSLKKIAAVTKFPRPTTQKQIQSFLGLTGYFRKFIENYSLIAKPLSDLLKGNQKFRFGPEQEVSFEMLKKKLSEEPVLQLYHYERETELHTDASCEGYGAVLLQKNDVDGRFHPIHYMSRKTSDAEKKYSSYELEVLAIIEALKKFRVYLLGLKFKIKTDCKAFAMTMNKKDLSTRVARWALLLEEFDYTIEHKPGNIVTH